MHGVLVHGVGAARRRSYLFLLSNLPLPVQ